MLYITINRRIVTIRMNTALIDYLANMRTCIWLVRRTRTNFLSREIKTTRQSFIYKVQKRSTLGPSKCFSFVLKSIQPSRQAVALAPSICSEQRNKRPYASTYRSTANHLTTAVHSNLQTSNPTTPFGKYTSSSKRKLKSFFFQNYIVCWKLI